jgi:cation transport regulator ChaC
VHVFGYGSLMSPASLAATLPHVALQDCVPGRLAGHVRTFDVAFPNDGSQPDKAYVAPEGHRPPEVLFANLRRADPGSAVNGLLIPATDEDLARLRERELRYQLVDVTDQASPYPQWGDRRGGVVAFVGRDRFTGPVGPDARLPEAYLRAVEDGAMYWEQRCPGFLADFVASTRAPRPSRVAALERIDLRT